VKEGTTAWEVVDLLAQRSGEMRSKAGGISGQSLRYHVGEGEKEK